MAPYIAPWSVTARAGISSSAARATRAGMRLAPSSSEYSVWLCRWTKVSGACGIVLAGSGGTPGVVYLALGLELELGVNAGVSAPSGAARHLPAEQGGDFELRRVCPAADDVQPQLDDGDRRHALFAAELLPCREVHC